MIIGENVRTVARDVRAEVSLPAEQEGPAAPIDAAALARLLFGSDLRGIVLFGLDGRIMAANGAFAALLGVPAGALAGQSLFELVGADGERLEAVVALSGPPQVEVAVAELEVVGRRPDGSSFAAELAIGRVAGDDPLFVAVSWDITRRKQEQERLRHQALHDGLTGLPNRVLFNDRIDHAFEVSQRTGQPLAVILLDLDRFKDVNDTFGHFAGDMLLRETANRLKRTVRTCDTVARLGGDEFGVLLPALGSEAQARELSHRIVRRLAQPFRFNRLALDVGVSAGIALYPRHGHQRDRLLQCADTAMYAAKKEGGGVMVFDADRHQGVASNLTLAIDLRAAIDERRVFLLYQPKVDLKDGKMIGVEALARWRHHLHGAIPPNAFFAHAEKAGLIHELTALTFGLGLGQLATWRQAHCELTVAINVSARSFHDGGLLDQLIDAMDHWRVRPEWLTLEITENALMIDPLRALRIVERLAALGVRLAIDDFGIGSSSLAYLSALPVSEVKIDRSFVGQMLHRDRDLRVVRAAVDLAHDLGLHVVAEGVESAQVSDLLHRLGCDHAQGYYFGRPMAPAEIPTGAE